MKKKSMIPVLIYAAILALLLMWVFGSFSGGKSDIAYSQILELFQKEQVKSFVVEDQSILLKLHNPYNGKTELRCDLADPEQFRQELGELWKAQRESGVLESYDFIPETKASAYDLVWPLLIVGGVLLIVWMMLVNRANNANPLNNFGKARTVLGIPDGQKVTFDDVAGVEEEKNELQEVVDFLRDPQKFTDIGARIPHGMLLVGPPGTGKTLLARAVAGEADVQFLSISGSDFAEMYVGVGASRVRDLFEEAKKVAPAVVFIDEIDAVGRQRGAGLGGGHDEREQTLNQLLVEMDGFVGNEGVVVLAATNRADILDPALLRPGRFDRQVYVGRPDIKGREEVLKVHVRNKPLAEDVDLKVLAQSTPGFTGADLENLVNEGALLAARKDQKFITMDDLQEAVIKVIAGPEKKSRVVPQHERKLTAYHEAGHAILHHCLESVDAVHQVTIVPRGKAGGMTISLPAEDRGYYSKRYMEEEIASLLGGRVAEAIALGDISTGASNDIQRASAMARRMVTVYGMSEKLGAVSFDSGSDEVFIGRSMAQAKNYSEEVAAQIDAEVKEIIDSAYHRCEEILTEHRDALERVAQTLLEKETISGEEFAEVMGFPKAKMDE